MRQVCNALLIASLTILTGCDPLSLTALGVGAGAGINHTVNGYTYHIFRSLAACQTGRIGGAETDVDQGRIDREKRSF